MNIKNYRQFTEALTGPGNLPMFTFTGVNYGDADKGVSGHFGDKPTVTPKSQKTSMDGIIVGEGEDFYTQSEVKELLSQYDVWCKQNNEQPIPVDKIDSKTISYISNLIGFKESLDFNFDDEDSSYIYIENGGDKSVIKLTRNYDWDIELEDGVHPDRLEYSFRSQYDLGDIIDFLSKQYDEVIQISENEIDEYMEGS